MKKLLVLILALMLVVAAFAACGTSEPAKTPEQGGEQQEVNEFEKIFEGIEPLAEKTKLKIGLFSGSSSAFPSWFIEKVVGFDKFNIDVEFLSSTSGPLFLEAMAADSWDVATYGLGGVIGSMNGPGSVVIANAIEDSAFRFFARKDGAIVKAGKNVPESPNLYGDKQSWLDAEILIPTGTTIHYTLVKAVEKFGLKSSDLKITHMDVANAHTAFRANAGDVVGLWNPQCFEERMYEDYVMVVDGPDVGVKLQSGSNANPRSLADPKKREAMKKWLELFWAVADWVNASEENLDVAVQYMIEFNEEEGIKSTEKDCKDSLIYFKLLNMEDNYKLATEKSKEYPELNGLQAGYYEGLNFYIEQGTYPESMKDEFKKDKYFDTSLILEVYEAKKK